MVPYRTMFFTKEPLKKHLFKCVYMIYRDAWSEHVQVLCSHDENNVTDLLKVINMFYINCTKLHEIMQFDSLRVNSSTSHVWFYKEDLTSDLSLASRLYVCLVLFLFVDIFNLV